MGCILIYSKYKNKKDYCHYDVWVFGMWLLLAYPGSLVMIMSPQRQLMSKIFMYFITLRIL